MSENSLLPQLWADAMINTLDRSLMSPTTWMIRLSTHKKLHEELQPLALLADIDMTHQVVENKRRSYFIFHAKGEMHFTVTESSDAEYLRSLLAQLSNPF